MSETRNERKDRKMNVNEITFGIEIECCVPVEAVRANGIVIGGYRRGVQV